MAARKPGAANTAQAVRDMLRRGPMTPSELIKALPNHNASTVSNALQIMLRVTAVTRSGRTYRLAPNLGTEAKYRAHLREFRAVRAPIDEDGEPGPYVQVLRTDPLSVALRSRW